MEKRQVFFYTRAIKLALFIKDFINYVNVGPGSCALVGWSIALCTKGRGFDSRSGPTPALWVQPLVGAHLEGS